MSRSHSSGGPGDPADRAVLPLGQRERRVIFEEMVKAEIEASLLRHSKRRQLLRYASKMGIPRFEAHLMIADVQFRQGRLQPPRILTAKDIEQQFDDARRYHRALAGILIATGVAAAVNILIVNWAFSS